MEYLDAQKSSYNESTGKLRKVKHDIERIQQILEQNKKRLQKDFEYWYTNLRKEATDGIKEIVEDAREEKRAMKEAEKAQMNRLVSMGEGGHLPAQSKGQLSSNGQMTLSPGTAQRTRGPSMNSTRPQSRTGDAHVDAERMMEAMRSQPGGMVAGQ